jgi:hypothetical protein
MFCVIRHAETGGLSVVPASAVDYLSNNGWSRVSDDRPEPGDFHLPEFAPDPDAASESPAEPDEEEE